MKDLITIQRVSELHPKFIPLAISFIDDIESFTELIWRVDQGLRTFAEQQTIWNQGRTTPGKIVTWSPSGSSYHNYGLAIDIVPLNKDGSINWKYNYKVLRSFAVKNGLELGLDFPHPDYDHFENRFGYNWRDLLHKYTIEDFIPGTQFVNL